MTDYEKLAERLENLLRQDLLNLSRSDVRDAATAIRTLRRERDDYKTACDSYAEENQKFHDRATVAERERDEALEMLRGTLAALVAITGIVIRAEDKKTRPSKVVASDAMFLQMLKDYDNATIAARAIIAKHGGRDAG